MWNHLLPLLLNVFLTHVMVILGVWCYLLHLQMDEQDETQGGEVTCPGSPLTLRSGFELWPFDSKSVVLPLSSSCFLSPFPGSFKQNKPASWYLRGKAFHADWLIEVGCPLWFILSGHAWPSVSFCRDTDQRHSGSVYTHCVTLGESFPSEFQFSHRQISILKFSGFQICWCIKITQGAEAYFTYKIDWFQVYNSMIYQLVQPSPYISFRTDFHHGNNIPHAHVNPHPTPSHQ